MLWKSGPEIGWYNSVNKQNLQMAHWARPQLPRDLPPGAGRSSPASWRPQRASWGWSSWVVVLLNPVWTKYHTVKLEQNTSERRFQGWNWFIFQKVTSLSVPSAPRVFNATWRIKLNLNATDGRLRFECFYRSLATEDRSRKQARLKAEWYSAQVRGWIWREARNVCW